MCKTHQVGLICICAIPAACAGSGPDQEDTAIAESSIEATEDAIGTGSVADNPAGADAETQTCAVRVGGRRANDSNSGDSWSQALATVQAGIERARARAIAENLATCDVWLRSGTYQPPTEQGFTLYSDVGLYGGFVGVESRRDQRRSQWPLVTVLRGAVTLQGDSSGTAVLDALEIASSVNIHSALLRVNNCQFTGTGTAIAGSYGMISVTASKFANAGDGVYCQCNMTVDGSSFMNDGIALLPVGGGNLNASNSIFVGVRSAISVDEGSATVNACSFRRIGDTAISAYDGMLTINDSVFQRNNGVSISMSYAGGTITNCKFWNNANTTIAVYGAPTRATVEHCSFNSNSAASASVGLASGSFANLDFSNSILWGNGANPVVASNGGVVTYRDSDVEGGASGTNVLNVDPLFINSIIGNLRLDEDSPVIGWGYQYP